MISYKLGQCLLGPHCPYVHDHRKVAICREFLKNGDCHQGSHCDLSHEPTYERVPACLHFLRGTCSKATCRYAHVRVSPTARVCRAFTKLGFCSKGTLCEEGHVFECPDYFRDGNCNNLACRLPHVDRAGQLRQHDTTSSKSLHEANDSELSSDGRNDSGAERDDVESEGLEDETMLVADDDQDHVLAHQDDFIHF